MNELRERLLLAELEQNYSWMQELLKHLLAWYAFFFTTNVALLGYLLNGEGKQDWGPLSPLMLFLDLCGFVLVFVAWRYFLGADARACLLIGHLNALAGDKIEMRSVFPRSALTTGLLFLAFGMAALAVVWGRLW
jgi:hypothetical protein